MDAVCAILAAGASARMGAPKALLRVGGETFVDRALTAAGGRPTALVVSSAVAATLSAGTDVRIVRNDEPCRGMSHSLALANAALGASDMPLVVLLVDTPLVDAVLVERVLRALASSDVAYPTRNAVPGHPVVFGPRARARIGSLPPGDTLRALRDDPALLRSTLSVDGDAPFADVDTPHDFERMRRV